MRTLKEFMSWVDQETLKEGQFDLDGLKTVPSHQDPKFELLFIKRYLTQTLGQPITTGTYRFAWFLDEKTVIKIPKETQFLVQNENEVRNAACMGKEHTIQVFDHHPRFYWIIEERVRPLSEEEFVQEFSNQIGVPLDMETELSPDIPDFGTALLITDMIEAMVNNERPKRYESVRWMFEKSPWLTKLIKKLQGCKVSGSDFHNENWGIRPSTGELVLLDLGF